MKLTSRSINLLSIAFLISGAALSMIASPATLTQEGAYITTLQQSEVVLPAATEPMLSMRMMGFGMLMMLIGFGLHMLYTIAKRDEEQTVPVRKAKQKRIPRPSRKQMEVIWVERTIRF